MTGVSGSVVLPVSEVRVFGVYLDKNRYIEKRRKKLVRLKTPGILSHADLTSLIARGAKYTGATAVPRIFRFDSAAHVQNGILVEMAGDSREDVVFSPETKEMQGTACVMLTYVEAPPTGAGSTALVSALRSKGSKTARRVRFGLHRNKTGRAYRRAV